MEQFVIARRRARYVKPISEPSRKPGRLLPCGILIILGGTKGRGVVHAAEGRRKWRSGDACRALTDRRARGKLE